MVQSPSWEANWFAASQEIPRISQNPKVHYRTHKRPPPVPILGKPNPVHIPTSHLLEIHPNIIHPSTPRPLPQWSPSHRFPHQDPIHPPLLTYTRHMPSPSHTISNCNCNYCILFDVWCVLTVHNILYRFDNTQWDGLSLSLSKKNTHLLLTRINIENIFHHSKTGWTSFILILQKKFV